MFRTTSLALSFNTQLQAIFGSSVQSSPHSHIFQQCSSTVPVWCDFSNHRCFVLLYKKYLFLAILPQSSFSSILCSIQSILIPLFSSPNQYSKSSILQIDRTHWHRRIARVSIQRSPENGRPSHPPEANRRNGQPRIQRRVHEQSHL